MSTYDLPAHDSPALLTLPNGVEHHPLPELLEHSERLFEQARLARESGDFEKAQALVRAALVVISGPVEPTPKPAKKGPQPAPETQRALEMLKIAGKRDSWVELGTLQETSGMVPRAIQTLLQRLKMGSQKGYKLERSIISRYRLIKQAE